MKIEEAINELIQIKRCIVGAYDETCVNYDVQKDRCQLDLESQWKSLGMAIEALKYMQNLDENYQNQKLSYQIEQQQKAQKCIERILSNYRVVQNDEDLEWNRCNDKLLEIIKEEMEVS